MGTDTQKYPQTALKSKFEGYKGRRNPRADGPGVRFILFRFP